MNPKWSLTNKIKIIGIFLVTAGLAGFSCSAPPVPPPPPPSISVQLTWSEADTVDSYNVYRARQVAGPFTKIGSSTSPEFLDKTPAIGLNVYTVTAVRDGAESIMSSDAETTVQ